MVARGWAAAMLAAAVLLAVPATAMAEGEVSLPTAQSTTLATGTDAVADRGRNGFYAIYEKFAVDAERDEELSLAATTFHETAGESPTQAEIDAQKREFEGCTFERTEIYEAIDEDYNAVAGQWIVFYYYVPKGQEEELGDALEAQHEAEQAAMEPTEPASPGPDATVDAAETGDLGPEDTAPAEPIGALAGAEAPVQEAQPGGQADGEAAGGEGRAQAGREAAGEAPSGDGAGSEASSRGGAAVGIAAAAVTVGLAAAGVYLLARRRGRGKGATESGQAAGGDREAAEAWRAALAESLESGRAGAPPAPLRWQDRAGSEPDEGLGAGGRL